MWNRGDKVTVRGHDNSVISGTIIAIKNEKWTLVAMGNPCSIHRVWNEFIQKS